MQGILTSKGLFTDKKEIQEHHLYFRGGTIPASIVYTTRIEDDLVYYVNLVDRLYHSDPSEFCEHMMYFANDAAYAESRMKDQADFSEEFRRVVENDLSWYNVDDYETWEQKRQRIEEESKQRAAIAAKTTYLDTKEVAKHMREQLKSVFPCQKFSVRIERFAGGSSITVKWLDGPTTKEVESIVGHMKAGHFDGMIDLYEYKGPEQQENGNYLKYGNEYLHIDREYSPESYTKLRDLVCEDWQVSPDDFPIITSSGSPWIKDDYNHELVTRSGKTMNQHLWRKASEVSFYEHSEPQDEPEQTDSGVVFGEYKGHPTITLPMENDKTFSFGLSKARAIVEHIEEIKRWIEEM